MKTCIIALLAVALAASLVARPDEPLQPTIRTHLFGPDYESLLSPNVEPPNQLNFHGYEVTGVLPQFVKTREPVQLVNPAAPEEYWPKEDNADRDPVTHNVTGFKILSIKF